LFLGTTVACGGGGATTSDYRAVCQTQKDCVGEETFLQQFDSVDACATAVEDTVTSKSGTCKEATLAAVACRADNLQCLQGVPTTGDRCASEISTQEDECDGSSDPEIASTEDFREFCNLTKNCVGDMAFQQIYEDVEDCVGTFEGTIGFLGEECRKLYSDAVLCDIENFQCTDNEPQMSQECQSKYQEFAEQCSMMN
jgi:hypothetical protein